MTKRNDIHRPSEINPADYVFVGVEVMKDSDDIVGASLMMAAEMERMREHQAKTGAKFSSHQHGGNCHVCGASAIYTIRWYHEATNSYIRTGEDCADKIWDGDAEGFRSIGATFDEARKVAKTVRDAKAGKQKAALILGDAGLNRAMEIFLMTDAELIALDAVHEVGAHGYLNPTYELATLKDIVGKLIKYGNISDGQERFLAKLVDQVDNRKANAEAKANDEAKRLESADEVPEGRVEITGEVASIKEVESAYGFAWKWLIVTDGGWKAWGTIPSAIVDEVHDVKRPSREDGKFYIPKEANFRVTFTAKMTKSDSVAYFGFYSRPTKASVVSKTDAVAEMIEELQADQ